MFRAAPWVFCAVMFLMAGCAKHQPDIYSFKSIEKFSGRLLVMTKTQRFQTEIDWQAEGAKGFLRITHASTGKIVELTWQNREMLWRDSSQSRDWQVVRSGKLAELGILLAPWQLDRIFRGDLPSSLVTKDNRVWKGSWGDAELFIRWASEQQKVEISDMRQGNRVVVVFNE